MKQPSNTSAGATAGATKARAGTRAAPEPFWYKSGVIYELHVRAFHDSDADGTGDFRGLTQKLDYLQELGVTALWLLPFYPSPLRDDGYDIADYYNVHPNYGTLGDFKLFLREAHRRGLRVITELVINHTSDQHPWFQRARKAAAGSRWRNFYVWSDTPDKYKGTRIIFKDIEPSNWSWDPVARAHYWHRFFAHQPDLNFDNEEVHREILKVLDFWLDLGVDGLRLDAVPYLYEREGTSCENLPETHAFLKKLRRHVDENYQGRMLLGEANQWPEDAIAYFGQGRGDECHMAFHFPLMPRLFMALRQEDRTPIVEILEQTPALPETGQWALFLRNHDELTLEMVTDEERDYMYRAYAHVHQARLNLGIRRRLAPLLGNDRRRIELLNALLLSLPGTPVIYYGDEIGMGENIFLGDRNGVRTPMQWSSDRNAGFSRANPQRLYLPIIYDPEYHYEANNVEAQLQNPHSLLWWTRRLLALRKRWRALGEGQCDFLQPDNRKILAYKLRHERETLLVVANLSRFPQPVSLDLSAFKQRSLIELFGRTHFPTITDQPYFLTLGPHAFYLFSIEAPAADAAATRAPAAAPEKPALEVTGEWTTLFQGRPKARIEALLPDYLRQQRWFGAKSRAIKQVVLADAIPLALAKNQAFITLLEVDYYQGEPDFYTLPLAFAEGGDAARLREKLPRLVIAELTTGGGARGVLYDAVGNPAFGRALVDWMARRRTQTTEQGVMEGSRTTALRRILAATTLPDPEPGRAEQSNTSLFFGDKLIVKLFRRLEGGVNLELELGRFLTERGFPHVPPLAGAVEYRTKRSHRLTLAVAHGFVPAAKDAWEHTLDALGRYFDRVNSFVAAKQPVPDYPANPLNALTKDVPAAASEIVGTYIESARLLGVRTGELHRAFSSEAEDPAFSPEPFTPHYVRGLFQSMRNLAVQNLRSLRSALKTLPPELVPMAQRVLDRESDIITRYRPIHERRLDARRTRIHGDYHLGQILHTGRDFIIIDFEGEPAVPLSERRIKRSPLRDTAGMLRSFDYAAHAGLHQHLERGSAGPEQQAKFEEWARYWSAWVSVAFLRSYLQTMADSPVLPRLDEELRVMLQAYLLNKAVYELGYELNHRPGWVRIPLQGILQLLGTPK